MSKRSWEEFNRFPQGGTEFFGIVNRDGEWVDSAKHFHAAMAFCCLADGVSTETVPDQLAHITEAGWSIVSGVMLRKMYEAGLIN